jgi:hypothetical protein
MPPREVGARPGQRVGARRPGGGPHRAEEVDLPVGMRVGRGGFEAPPHACDRRARRVVDAAPGDMRGESPERAQHAPDARRAGLEDLERIVEAGCAPRID